MMNLIPFYIVDPDLVSREMRVMHLLVKQEGLSAGSYELLEFYCPDPDCDCRRVMLTVVEGNRPDRFLASISYAFDRNADMPGPFLDPLNRQSKYAQQLLELVEGAVLTDQRYLDRLERHYALVKRAASDPNHPAYEKLQELLSQSSEDASYRPVTSRATTVGRNDPCPCGSGRKYKHCCMRRDRGAP